jgi:predicted transcriptional regulator of viral defense system
VDTQKVVLLKIIKSRGGQADTQQIYGDMEQGEFITLTENQLRETIYEERPGYQHEVRSLLSRLTKEGYLRRESRGSYLLTESGKRYLASS